MASRFHGLRAALNDTFPPALRAAGFSPPGEPFNRSTARYEFTRAAPDGTQTIAVLFQRDRKDTPHITTAVPLSRSRLSAGPAEARRVTLPA